jgi:hypothetical protein
VSKPGVQRARAGNARWVPNDSTDQLTDFPTWEIPSVASRPLKLNEQEMPNWVSSVSEDPFLLCRELNPCQLAAASRRRWAPVGIRRAGHMQIGWSA